MRNTIFLHDELSLSSFTRARSAKQNNTHYENPLKGCRYFLKSAKRYHHHAFRSRKPPDAETVNEEKSRKKKVL
ncbi:hypothetical protein YQ86_03090 [Salmonella enterica subsp. enterica]|nr:hypothetical protein [Salmonella enterica subsp. enterica serovar Bispebjerg]ECF6914785.1 hypothetical protein [Salmonella enterica subsp. enterica]EBS5919353.1 hypothetical protein [Salmonella enterica subsp. enterica serovar Bispebjerg]EBX0276058.1 hypothetical protein [Salmonella enterica subsp. enterica serovar Bispebjerg]EBY0913313.1 hypothetical protein [Salmonella enterica subsp. enterica serovar Bispebjerg]